MKKNNSVTRKEFTELREQNNLLRACYKCSPLQKKLIEQAVSVIQTQDCQTLFGTEKQRISKFKITDFIEKYELDTGGNEWEQIKKACNGLINAHFREETSEYLHLWNWFSSIHANVKTNEIEFIFTQTVGDAILNLTKNYGVINVNVTKHFQSFYAAKWYDYAISMKGMKGKFFDLSEKQIREFMGVGDEKYKNRLNNFEQYVIKKPIQELNSIPTCNFTLDVTPIYNERGIKKIGWRFHIKEKYRTLAISKKDRKDDKATKRTMNSENEFIAKHKAEYDELVAKIHEETANDEDVIHRSLAYAEMRAFDIISKKYEYGE